MVELADCFAPVQAELAGLEQEIQGELASDSKALSGLVGHISKYAGKRLRPALVFLSAKAAGGKVIPEHDKLAIIVELIHTATLVHDDILDGADVRRRVATVNAMYGNHVPVLLGDFIYAHAFAMSVDLPTPDASRILARVTKIVCKGEINQIFDRFDFALTEPRYLKIIEAKTAELYAASCELGAIYSGADRRRVEALERYGRSIGIAFQIIDDCLDLIGDEGVVGKSLGTDLESGKLTLPLIHFAANVTGAERQRFESLIRDESAANRRARLSEEFDIGPSLDYAFRRADDFIKSAMDDLDTLPPTPSRDALRAVAEFVLCRKR
ncbi:MAG: polyprenyl synthetase family protein [Planctomycetes bacterium]|nr:polyprenyl synthetase family protein [Planctomycetota bacterium]